MIQRLKAASFWAKLGYASLAITVLLGLSNVGEKAWTQGVKLDARYAKQVDLNDTNTKLAEFQKQYDIDKVLQLQQQLFDMEIRWGADRSKWTEAQKALYFQKKMELDNLKAKIGLK